MRWSGGENYLSYLHNSSYNKVVKDNFNMFYSLFNLIFNIFIFLLQRSINEPDSLCCQISLLMIWTSIEAVVRRCSVKKVFLEISACNFIKKESLAQVFSCGFCEISGDTFFKNISGGCFYLYSFITSVLDLPFSFPPEIIRKLRVLKVHYNDSQ